MTVRQDSLVSGPFFNQVPAGNVRVEPTNGSGDVVTLGQVANASGAANMNDNGMPSNGMPLNIISAKSVAGVGLTATAGATDFGLAVTPGTSAKLTSKIANSSTVNNTALWETSLPESYVEAEPIILTANLIQTLTAGATLTTSQVILQAYEISNDGTSSAGLISTGNTIAITGSVAADHSVTLPATGLAPGDRLMITAKATAIESAGTNASISLNSLRLS